MSVLDTTATPNAPASFWNTVLRYGGFCGLALVVVSLISYLIGANIMSISGMLINFVVALAITIGFSAMAIKFQRDNLDGGFIGFGRALLIGLLSTAIGTFISSIWNYVLINFIDPGYIDNMKEQFMSTWGENMPAEALEQAMEKFDKSGDIGTILTNGVTAALVLGLIAGLIAAAIMRRNPPIE